MSSAGGRGVDVLERARTVNELLIAQPEAIEVLNRFGIDACCGGADTLAEAAERAGVDAQALMHELRRVVEDG